MADIVYGERPTAGPLQELIQVFSAGTWDGTLYVGYPIISTVEGILKVDALYVSRKSGVVVFDLSHLDDKLKNGEIRNNVRETLDKYYAAINSRLTETPELLKSRQS